MPLIYYFSRHEAEIVVQPAVAKKMMVEQKIKLKIIFWILGIIVATIVLIIAAIVLFVVLASIF